MKIRCLQSSQVGLVGPQSKAGGSACVPEGEESCVPHQGFTVTEPEVAGERAEKRCGNEATWKQPPA